MVLMSTPAPANHATHTDTTLNLGAGQARVVFLVNFLSPNLVEVMREASRGLGALDIVVSVPMEANRNWQVDNRDLSVITQRTWTKRKLARHPGGYVEELFVHVPLDTWMQLNRLNPDVVVSLEMGMRSIQSSLYRRLWSRKCRHVLAVYGSERSEAGRGWLRRMVRRRLFRAADIVTYNGPSCYRYLVGQGAHNDRMLPWNYAADPLKPYRGPLIPTPLQPVRLLSVGQLIPRKGMDRACESLKQWAVEHSGIRIEWSIAGTGPQADWFRSVSLPDNFRLNLLGHCDADQLRQLYADHAIHFFPTLGDEWGLVVDEALHSGQIVLGSVHSQAVETLIEPGSTAGPTIQKSQPASQPRSTPWSLSTTVGSGRCVSMRDSQRWSAPMYNLASICGCGRSRVASPRGSGLVLRKSCHDRDKSKTKETCPFFLSAPTCLQCWA